MRPEARPGATIARFLPDLALSAAFIAIFYLFAIFGGPSALFRDADAGWHIRSGEQILTARSLPQVDSFSFSKPGEAWIAWEWGADVIVGGVHRLAGLSGVAFFYLLAIGLSVWMWVRLNWAAGGNFVLACLFLSPLLSTVNLHWLARPHVLGWLFLVGTVWLCERMPKRLTAARLAAIACAGALWANLHGSFFMGPAVLALYALGDGLGSVIWGTLPTRSRSYLLAAVVAALGTLLNPYGWQLHRHVFAYLLDAQLLDRIGEFQSFNFHAPGAAQIVFALLIALAGGFAALSARRMSRFLLTIAITAAALRSARMLPVAALILLPLANGSLSSVLMSAELTAPLRRALDAVLDYGHRLRAMDRTVNGLALAPFTALLIFGVLRAAPPAFPSDQFPVAAAAEIPADARTFASDKFGGYLIYRFNGQRPVFFDGRSDFYGADFLKSYARIVQLRPGWREEFGRWHFTHALLPPDAPLIAALESQGWHELRRDPFATLLEAANR